MSKQLFALSFLLTYTVVSGRYPFDRRLQEGADQGTGNEWQYCEDTCNKTCEPCEQHHVCAEDEIKCGEGPTRVSPDGFVLHLCAKDEICVSDKCGCKYKTYRLDWNKHQRRIIGNNCLRTSRLITFWFHLY